MTYAAPDSKKIMSLVNRKMILDRGDNDSDLIGFLRVEGSAICMVMFFAIEIFVYIKEDASDLNDALVLKNASHASETNFVLESASYFSIMILKKKNFISNINLCHTKKYMIYHR